MKDVFQSSIDRIDTRRNSASETVHTYPHALYLHGGAALEGLVRTMLTVKTAAKHAAKSLHVTSDDTIRSDSYPDSRAFQQHLRANHLPVTPFEFVPETAKRDFSVQRYTQAAQETITTMAAEGHLDILIGHSVGSLAALESVALRIDSALNEGLDPKHLPPGRPDLALPKLLVLIDPLLGGLTDVAQTYLHASGQTKPGKAVPGLLDLFPNSPYLSSLQDMLAMHAEYLPPTIVIDGISGTDYIACPLAAVPVNDLAPYAKKLGMTVSPDNDGMANSVRYSDIWPEQKIAVVTITGSPHVKTLVHASPIVSEIMKHGSIQGTPIQTLLKQSPDTWPSVDHSAWLMSRENKVMGRAMLAIFAGISALPGKHA